MRFGICCPPDRSAELASLGFDYVEWPMSRAVGRVTDAEYQQLQTLARQLTVKPECWNVMLPSDIKVTGPDVDLSTLTAYLETAFRRASELGGEIVVFGSGGSRTLPDGWHMEEGLEQFAAAASTAGAVAARHGLTIALEPLNSSETNLMNTVAEGQEIVERVRKPSVRLLSDLYHVYQMHEPIENTETANGVLAHVHVAAPEGRNMTLPDRQAEVVQEYFAALKRSGYDGRISFEGRWDGSDEAKRGLEFLRQTWDNASR